VYAVKGADTLRMDRYDTPSDTGLRPCVIFVFGGGFANGTRDGGDYVPFYEWLAGNGYTVVAIDYRLGMRNLKERVDPHRGGLGLFRQVVEVFHGSIAMAVEDLFDATAFVVAHAGEWRIDTANIIACGSSAGAVTVLQAEYERCNATALSQRLPQGFGYAGVISFAGAIFSVSGDLHWRTRPAPILLFHGDADKDVPYDNIRYRRVGFYGSKHIAAQLAKLNTPYWFYAVENTGHAVSNSPMSQNRTEIDAFLTRMVVGRQHLRLTTTETPLDAPKQKKKLTLREFLSGVVR
ncbi:MAG: alpha/beta hydrolase, partial [Prevotellaceae bacterium]|nr:alpha/beta hydrolase [Prevotellaceae bacterium]